MTTVPLRARIVDAVVWCVFWGAMLLAGCATPAIYDQRFTSYCACDDLECIADREQRGRYDGPHCLPAGKTRVQ